MRAEPNADKMNTSIMPQQARETKKEPLPSNERYRDYALPCGLKNIGNSKYFVSL